MPRVENKEEVLAYIEQTKQKTAMERTELNKIKLVVKLKVLKPSILSTVKKFLFS